MVSSDRFLLATERGECPDGKGTGSGTEGKGTAGGTEGQGTGGGTPNEGGASSEAAPAKSTPAN